MLKTLHRAGHRHLKVLFVLALASSSALFFMGRAVPNPPPLALMVIGGVLGVAVEWFLFTVSCDLTQSITERHMGSIARDLFYTVLGSAASWFLFTNAALHVGWAPTDDLLGLSRTHWAMIMGALVVLIVFALSARREKPESDIDIEGLARSIRVHTPDLDDQARLRVLAEYAGSLERARQRMLETQKGNVVESLPATKATPTPPSPLTLSKETPSAQESEGASNGNHSF